MIRGLALALLASCGLEVEQPEPSATSHVIRFEVPTPSVKPIDVLFVLDESPAMAAEHARVVASMAGFAQAFEAKLAGQDLNVGVITTDPSARGQLVGGGFFHERSTVDAIERDFIGTLDDRLASLADHESRELEPNQPLDMSLLALDPATNPGFHRPDARLFLVILTNRDDESSRSPDAYDALVSEGAARFYLALFERLPSPRLEAFAEEFGGLEDSYFAIGGIDQPSYGDQHLFTRALLPPFRSPSGCLDAIVATPHDCTISDVTNGIETGQLLECANDSLPCWRFESAPQQCSGVPGLVIRVDRAVFPPPNTWIRGQCVTDSPSN